MTVTAIQSNTINLMVHVDALQRAQQLVVLIKRALEKSDRKALDAITTPFERLQHKYAHQSLIASMAAKRLTKMYERQLMDLLINRV